MSLGHVSNESQTRLECVSDVFEHYLGPELYCKYKTVKCMHVHINIKTFHTATYKEKTNSNKHVICQLYSTKK